MDAVDRRNPKRRSSLRCVGITGHLQLNEQERRLVTDALNVQFHRWLATHSRPPEIQLLSGLAPGTDLVVCEALMGICAEQQIQCRLVAVLVDSAELVLSRWLQRLQQHGIAVSAERQAAVELLFHRMLDQASHRLIVVSDGHDPSSGYRRLASIIASQADTLIAALRSDYAGQAGGSQETVTWWKNPDAIPRRWRLDAHRSEPGFPRHLISIDPQSDSKVTLHRDLPQIDRILAHLKAGNALSANDLARRTLGNYPGHEHLRYLYVLSLAAAGSPARALRHYKVVKPAKAGAMLEEWLALKGRLYKDLAFAGQQTQRNLTLAAACYRDAYEQSGGSFSAVNAASLNFLGGQLAAAQELARAVCELCENSHPDGERERYFHAVTYAEAWAVLGRWQDCKEQLQRADPLLRDDLVARSRTRQQLARLLRAHRAEVDILSALALPSVYLLDEAALDAEPGPVMPAHLLQGAPVYALGAELAPGFDTTPSLQVLTRLGGRLHCLSLSREKPRGDVQKQYERQLGLRGFLDDEADWRLAQARRQLYGLARLNSQHLGVDVQKIVVSDRAGGHVCSAGPAAPPAHIDPPYGRIMAGIVFTDLAGFSHYSDRRIQHYWQVLVPAIIEQLSPLQDAILLRRSWGDAIHIVTRDIGSAAEVTQVLQHCSQQLARSESADEQEHGMRISAHFGPVFVGQDEIEKSVSFYGSQISLTARVEPITPTGTTYVTEQFAAEYVASGEQGFELDYAGELPLAKDFGRFRLYSLKRAS